MLSLLLGGLKGIWGYIAAAGAALAAILVAYFQAKKAGANEVVVETQKKELENVKVANKVEQDVASTPPDVVRDKLRDQWTRD